MANDLINVNNNDNIMDYLTPKLIVLNLDKRIFLLNILEEDNRAKKKYIRSQLIAVNNQILTFGFSDTVHFMDELALFDAGNDQNKYFTISEHQNTKNLKIKNIRSNIFISKSEAKAICRLFNLSLNGYSLSTVLENGVIFSAEDIENFLNKNRVYL
jgi:hypothetical protein